MNTNELCLGGWLNALLISAPTLMVANTINSDMLLVAGVLLTLFNVGVRVMIDSATRKPFNGNKIFSYAIGAAISAVVVVGSYFSGTLTI